MFPRLYACFEFYSLRLVLRRWIAEEIEVSLVKRDVGVKSAREVDFGGALSCDDAFLRGKETFVGDIFLGGDLHLLFEGAEKVVFRHKESRADFLNALQRIEMLVDICQCL